MTLTSNALISVPDGPPLLTMARMGTVLHVTVLHATAADLIWQHRQQFTEIHGCSGLRLSVLSPAGSDGKPTELQWQRPNVNRRVIRRAISWRRR